MLLKNGNMLGDTIMMTSAVRDLKIAYPDTPISVETNYSDVWLNNPYIERWQGDGPEYSIGPAIVIQGSKSNGLHFANAFRVCLETKMGKPIKQGPLRGDLHFSEEEKKRPIITGGKYWVIDIDCGPYNAKRWYNDRWQEVVNTLHWLTFVQVGVEERNDYRLKGTNVIDMVGMTTVRQLLCLHYHAEGSLGLTSSQMHIAGALQKPCVTIAGAREPQTLIKYPTHRLLENVGSLPCAKLGACWSCSGCSHTVHGRSKCMHLIEPRHVVEAVESYYKGGVLTHEDRPLFIDNKTKPSMKVICNTRAYGGAERSSIEIIKQAVDKGYSVEIITRDEPCKAFKQELPPVTWSNNVTGPCDVLLLYASDMVFDFKAEQFVILEKVQAKRKVMALTYGFGGAGKVEWTKGWDLYLFLNEEMRGKFLERTDGETMVLPPPVDLEEFFKIKPPYSSTPITIARHSSQGDLKYPPIIANIVKECPFVKFKFMPKPTFLPDLPNVQSYRSGEVPVSEFLKGANCFWYLLPEGYTDQGPRAVMEAMAAGLPVICDNRSGPGSRVSEETGWPLDDQYKCSELIKSLNGEVLQTKGVAARNYAKTEFDKNKWLEVITNG